MRRRRTRRVVGSSLIWVGQPEVVRFVAVRSQRGWGDIRRSVCFATVAAELHMSEAMVAMALKHAETLGLVRATSPRTLQVAYVATDKLDRELGLV